MQKIAADKVNIMEYGPESASVTITFFPKSNSVHYYVLTMELWEKSVVWMYLYKIIYQGVQENIVILNVTIFVFNQILLSKYYTFCELNSNMFSAVLQ